MLSCAFFRRGFNTQLSSRNEMVQCLTCFECYHCVCLGISFEEAKDSTIVDCGWTLPHPYRSHDISVYSNQGSILRFLEKAYLKTRLFMDVMLPEVLYLKLFLERHGLWVSI
ncbi:unnamed protein product [Pocillopora meandrina]|uniref:Uncharacterized protein n=1 Tax=Pocillopora meandrina TaxID=46732 RepID=A0AAU9X724_9CNID|nr:unnamed protein product [Pocillopora meandrina]